MEPSQSELAELKLKVDRQSERLEELIRRVDKQIDIISRSSPSSGTWLALIPHIVVAMCIVMVFHMLHKNVLY
jgi:hypothetical protein